MKKNRRPENENRIFGPQDPNLRKVRLQVLPMALGELATIAQDPDVLLLQLRGAERSNQNGEL